MKSQGGEAAMMVSSHQLVGFVGLHLSNTSVGLLV